jgi:hypothetical protein
MEQISPLTQITFNIIEHIYMFRPYKAIIRLPLEHLKNIKTAKAINVISFLQIVSQIFRTVYNVIYNGIQTDKKTRETNMSAWSTGQPARSVVLQHSGDRTVCSAHGVLCMVVNSGPFSSRTS